MKRNKHLLFLLIVISMFSCNKKDVKFEVIPPPCEAVSVEPYLVGKWKMVSWVAGHSNLYICSSSGGNTYNCEDWGTNVVIEIEADGMIKTYKDDTLVNESITTRFFFESSQVAYRVNCGETSFNFYTLSTSDQIENTELGDTIKIKNPYVDINFSNSVIRSITTEQKYMKIE